MERILNKFLEFGGEVIYGAWRLTFDEPFFKNKNFLGRNKFVSKKNLNIYKSRKLCPNVRYLQKRILQFKTNYWNISEAKNQALVLKKTLNFFDKK